MAKPYHKIHLVYVKMYGKTEQLDSIWKKCSPKFQNSPTVSCGVLLLKSLVRGFIRKMLRALTLYTIVKCPHKQNISPYYQF